MARGCKSASTGRAGITDLRHLKSRLKQLSAKRTVRCEAQIAATKVSVARGERRRGKRKSASFVARTATTAAKTAPSVEQIISEYERRRAHYIARLAASEQMTRCALEKLPHDNEPYTRLQLCNQFIERQQRARNPDSLLMAQLLISQRQILRHFGRFPDDLSTLKLVHRAKGKIPKTLVKHDLESLYPLMSIYKVTLRLGYALNVGSAIGMLHGQLIAGSKLQLAEVVLAHALQPDFSSMDFELQLEQRINEQSQRDDEVLLLPRLTCGYTLLPRTDQEDPIVIVHPRGAIAFPSKNGPYDIDLSLLTDDESAFPDPQRPAWPLPYKSRIYGCIYLDRQGRRREVIYDKATDGLILHG